MINQLTIVVGKIISKITKKLGGGSALPGLIMEKINPNFIKRSLNNLDYGVVVISGTNGKTSTTKMIVEILKNQGLNVFTNKTGSNFLRGVGSSLLMECDFSGKINADIAVLELDEAHAVHFVKQIKPRYSLLLNVMRDQLDRFGELDTVAKMLEKVAKATTKTVILNNYDYYLNSLTKKLDNYKTFGYSDNLKDFFTHIDQKEVHNDNTVDLELLNSKSNYLKLKLYGQKIESTTQINGIYNHYNLCGAILLAKTILAEKFDWEKIEKSIKNIRPAFGRGESFVIGDSEIDLILVKNPSGFQMALKALTNKKAEIMIAINDNYADGRDTSWLWDVDFSVLPKNVLVTTGSRSKEIANRLRYDEKTVKFSEEDVIDSLNIFLDSKKEQKQIFATYTAMLKIREYLRKIQGQKNGRFN